MDALDQLLFDLLGQTAGLRRSSDQAALRAWWQAEARPGELLRSFLVRQGILRPDALPILDVIRRSNLRDAEVATLLAPNAQDVLRQRLQPNLSAVAELPPPAGLSTVRRSGPLDGNAARVTPAAAGTTTIGKCRSLDPIGTGAFGTVYRGTHQTLNVPIALKLLTGGRRTLGPEGLLELGRIVHSLARHSSPHLVRTHALDESGSVPFLLMEWVDGLSLADLIRLAGALMPRRAVQVALQVTAGLAAAHAAGVVHGDLKPANILIARDGTAKVADLGLTAAWRVTDGRRAGSAGQTSYAAPEQWTADATADPRNDIYALGVTLYEALTGRHPFRGNAAGGVEPPHLRHPAVAPALSAVVLKMLAPDPARRFATAAEVQAALRVGHES